LLVTHPCQTVQDKYYY